MKLMWRFFILALSFAIFSCNAKEEKAIDPPISKEKKEAILENDESGLRSNKESIHKEVATQTIEEPSKGQPAAEPSKQSEVIQKVTHASESIVNLYEEIDAQNINQTTLIGLVEEGVNQIRKDNGLSIFQNRRNLKDAAAVQNDYCIKISGLSHNHDQGKYANVRDRVLNFGGRYSSVGENIQYYGFLNNEINGEVFLFPPDYQEAANDIVKAWVESPGHYENIVNKDFRSFGTALGWNDQLHAIFVTQVYGG